ncbi:MAG: ubiquitin-like protein [Candidatus Hodarchaeota archaeon]
MKVIEGGDLDGRAYMCPDDMKELGLEDLDVVIFSDEYGAWGAVQVTSSDDCDKDNILIDKAILDSAKISDTVQLKKSRPKGGIQEVQIGVEPMESQAAEDAVVFVAEHINEMTVLLKNRPIFKNLEINWRNSSIGHLKLKIMETTPSVEGDETAIIDPSGSEVVFEIVPSVHMNFNTILLIDVSGSMQRDDLVVQEVSTDVEALRRNFEDIEKINSFLDQFQEGATATRISSAAMAILIYLNLKVERKHNENIQLITFGDDVEVLEVENNEGEMSSVIECTGKMRELNANTLAWYIVEKAKRATGLTAMSVALKVASEQLGEFPADPKTGKRKPTMIILLSDGNPNKGDEELDIPVNPIPVAKQDLMREDVVIFTIGLGEADDVLMTKLAKDIGRGEYFRATSIKALWRFYDELAQRFSIATRYKGSKVKEEVAAPPAEQPTPEEETITPSVNEDLFPTKAPVKTKEPKEEFVEPVQKTPKIDSKTPGPEPSIVSKTPEPEIISKTPAISVFFMATIGPGEKNIKVSINPKADVLEVKETVGEMFGLNPGDFYLVYGGITMDEAKSVEDYNVKDGDTMMLIPASTAG